MSIEKLNQQLEAVGMEPVKDVDQCPERTYYLELLANPDWDDKDWVKQLKAAKQAYLDNFDKHLGEVYPHLLYEEGEDKTYWSYDEEIGIYYEVNFSTVRGWLMSLLESEGLKGSATESFCRNCFARYRGSFPERGKGYEDFDKEADWFHAANGWVNVDTLKFEKHTPKRLSRRVSAVKYDKKAVCPRYDQFLDEDIQIKEDAIRVVDQFSGLLLTPEIKYEKMLTLIGRPASGKSTLLNIWKHVLGDMATQKRLTEISGESARFIGASLVGRTLCWFDEVDVKRSEMGNSLVTMITGDSINVERKGINHIAQARNSMKCVLTANSLPLSSEHGMYRRLILIYFERSFYDEGCVNNNIREELEIESSGILNRMIRGLQDLRKYNGFTVIGDHDDLVEAYKVSSDPIAEFLDTYFEPATEEYEIESRALFDAYRDFKGGDGFVKSLTPQKFGLMMRTQPLTVFSKVHTKKYKTGNRWVGLKLKEGLKMTQEGRIEISVNYDF